jgi:PKD repeat protein
MKRTLLSLVALLIVTMSSFAQWTEQATGFTTASRGISYISIANPNVVWATAYDGSGDGAIITEFTRTVNGGTLWTPGQVLTSTVYGLGNISAIDENTAWVALYNSTTQDNNCGIYKTTDGGATWTHQAVALVGSLSFADNVYFWNANEGMCHGDVKDGYFEIYTTSDGGTTWTRVPQANINATVVSGEGGWTSVIDAAGDSSVYFGSNKGKLYISHDRGHHWVGKATGIVPVTNGGVQHIAFVDKLHGYVAQDKNAGATTDTTLQIFGTADGGETWAPITTTGWVFSACLAAVKNSPSTYVTAGSNFGNGTTINYTTGSSYSFDGHAFTGFPGTIGQGVDGSQFLFTSFYSDAAGWSGHFNASNIEGGIWKFIGVLAQPIADFSTPDTALTLGTSAHFTNLSTGAPTTYAWTFQGGYPATSIAQTPTAIQYNTPGDFDVTLTVTSEMGTNTNTKTGYIHVGGVGINDQTKATIMVFPNPASDVVNVQASSNIVDVQIFNLVGQLVLNQKVGSKNVSVNTSNLKSGVYDLKVVMNDGFINKKIIVK